jgi:excisionase family DNA binding protein
MTTRNDRPATMSVEQAGELLGISRRSAYRAAATGQLPTLRLGRRILVPTAALHRMLAITPPGHIPAPEPANPPDDHDQGHSGSGRRSQAI